MARRSRSPAHDSTAIVRDVFVADNWSTADDNIGSRLAFLRDGTLLMTTGDRHMQTPAQDQTRHWGKILRLRDDGSVPPDNPFVDNALYRPEIFSTGHRNPQSSPFIRRPGRFMKPNTHRLAATS